MTKEKETIVSERLKLEQIQTKLEESGIIVKTGTFFNQ